MVKVLPILPAFIVCLSACNVFKMSKYEKYNHFNYTQEQPSFHFVNDKLKIQGSWFWATGNRVMPKVSYLPYDVKRILKPIAKKHGSVLFATWSPQSRKYSKAGPVIVKKRDVRKTHNFINPFYEIVLISDLPFKLGTDKYIEAGKNNDYQFSLYFNPPRKNEYNYWVMETLALENDKYLSFVVIMDSSYIRSMEDSIQQVQLFVDDIKQNFSKQD
jgi:hypothetical protein